MPEFEFTWKNHPIHVVGAKIYCMVCDNPSLASLTIGRNDSPCHELRSKWKTEGLSTRILDTDSDRAFMNSERLTQMARCVIASAIQAISDELRINPDLAQLLYTDFRDVFFSQNINDIKRAPEHNLTYSDWLQVLTFWIPEMDSPFRMAKATGHSRNFIAEIKYLSSKDPELCRKLLAMNQEHNIFSRQIDFSKSLPRSSQTADIVEWLREISPAELGKTITHGLQNSEKFVELLSAYKLPKSPIKVKTPHGILVFADSNSPTCASHTPDDGACRRYMKEIDEAMKSGRWFYSRSMGQARDALEKFSIQLLHSADEAELEHLEPFTAGILNLWAGTPAVWRRGREIAELFKNGCEIQEAINLVAAGLTLEEVKRWWIQSIYNHPHIITAATIAGAFPQFADGEIAQASLAMHQRVIDDERWQRYCHSAAFIKAIVSGWPIEIIDKNCPSGTDIEIESMLSLGDTGRLLLENLAFESSSYNFYTNTSRKLDKFSAPPDWDGSLTKSATDPAQSTRARYLARKLEIEARQAAEKYRLATAAWLNANMQAAVEFSKTPQSVKPAAKADDTEAIQEPLLF